MQQVIFFSGPYKLSLELSQQQCCQKISHYINQKSRLKFHVCFKAIGQLSNLLYF